MRRLKPRVMNDLPRVTQFRTSEQLLKRQDDRDSELTKSPAE